ncbi:MAG: chromosomal replication initiator protein DnaA [Deltaproteobacteria bacterium]|nr:chromosomal replication initiator protein DnaA [Deltaproteobacteria bacterium]
MNKKNIWNQVTEHLESSISKSEIKTWFSSTSLIELDKNLSLIEVPNKFIATWLSDNYMDQIQKSFYETVHYLPEIRFTHDGSKPDQGIENYKTENKSSVRNNNQLNQALIFTNFVTAKCNLLAFSSASAVANKPAQNYNPFYMFSNLSSGKTHLMNAIGNQVVNNNPSLKVIYVSIDQLSLEFSLASKNRNLSKFRTNYKNGDFLLLDDIHQIGGRKKLQKELISIFNHYYESKKQIVAAGKSSPGQIKNLQPELRSRLEWGLLVELQVPDNKTRMEIVKKTAKKEKLYIPDDVAFFLSNATDDLNALNKYLVGLGVYTSLNKKEINISTVKSIIKNKQSYTINVKDIQKLTADHFNISLTDLLSTKKTYKFSYPRHVAMYLSRELTGLSFKQIAKEFGNKDHSTIIYAVKRIEKDKEQKKSVAKDLNKLQTLLS